MRIAAFLLPSGDAHAMNVYTHGAVMDKSVYQLSES